MLSFLLDEQISPQVVMALSVLQADVPVISLYSWRGGAMTGTDDSIVMQGALEDGLTLVTYDLKTIPPILVEWEVSGRSHCGVIFVDNCSIAPADFGGLARSLLFCFEAQGNWEWSDRVVYLRST